MTSPRPRRPAGRRQQEAPAGRGRRQREQEAGGGLRLRGDLLAAGILATLRRWNAHGYRLGRELVQAGLPVLDSGTLYRTLRELERAGLVSSFWDTSSAGPARRTYSLTKSGDVFLAGWVETLQRFQQVFQQAAAESGGEPAAAPPRRRAPARKQPAARATRGRKAAPAPPRTTRGRRPAAREE